MISNVPPCRQQFTAADDDQREFGGENPSGQRPSDGGRGCLGRHYTRKSGKLTGDAIQSQTPCHRSLMQDHLHPLLEAGARGFKCFMCFSGVDEFPQVNRDDLEQAYARLQNTSARILVSRLIHQSNRRLTLGPFILEITFTPTVPCRSRLLPGRPTIQ